MSALWDEIPDLTPAVIKRVLDALEKKGLVAHVGDERDAYVDGMAWWSTRRFGPS